MLAIQSFLRTTRVLEPHQDRPPQSDVRTIIHSERAGALLPRAPHLRGQAPQSGDMGREHDPDWRRGPALLRPLQGLEADVRPLCPSLLLTTRLHVLPLPLPLPRIRTCPPSLPHTGNRWDEWVDASRLLKFNETNIQLQKALQSQSQAAQAAHASSSKAGKAHATKDGTGAGGRAGAGGGRKDGGRGTKRGREEVSARGGLARVLPFFSSLFFGAEGRGGGSDGG